MPTNRKSYNGAYEVETKGKCEEEMTSGNITGASDKSYGVKSNGSDGEGSSKPSKSNSSEY